MSSKVIQLYIHIFFHVLFHYRLLQDIEYSPLFYTVGPHCLSILYIVVCICLSQTPNLSLLPPSPLVTMSVSLLLFCKLVHLYQFLDSTYE